MRAEEYGSWINEKCGPDICFTGLFHAFPEGTFTHVLQLALSLARHDLSSPFDVDSLHFRLPQDSGTKRMRITPGSITSESFQHYTTGHYRYTRLCGHARCMHPGHIILDSCNVSSGHQQCFQAA